MSSLSMPGTVICWSLGRLSKPILAGAVMSSSTGLAVLTLGTRSVSGNDAFKNFVSQKLPFKQFNMNATYYYLSLAAFLLLEAFKQDVCHGIIPISAYSSTVRRQLFDIAGKIIRKSRYTILKVTASIMKRLEFDTLWERCNNPPIKFIWL